MKCYFPRCRGCRGCRDWHMTPSDWFPGLENRLRESLIPRRPCRSISMYEMRCRPMIGAYDQESRMWNFQGMFTTGSELPKVMVVRVQPLPARVRFHRIEPRV